MAAGLGMLRACAEPCFGVQSEDIPSLGSVTLGHGAQRWHQGLLGATQSQDHGMNRWAKGFWVL